MPEIHEIDSVEKLEAYLMTQPVSLSRFVAARNGLRAFPAFTKSFDDSPLSSLQKKRFFITVLRGVLICWLAYEHNEWLLSKEAKAVSSELKDFEKVLLRPNNAFRAISRSLDAIETPNSSPFFASRSVVSLGRDPMYSDINVLLSKVTDDIIRGSAIFIANEHKRDVNVLNESGRLEFFPPVFREKNLIPDQLIEWIGLWFESIEHGLVGTQNLVADCISRALSSLALGDVHFWRRDPDLVVKDLWARLHFEVSTYTRDVDEAVVAVSDQLIQTPADFRFSAQDYQPIDAIPFSDMARDRHFAETTLKEAIEKAQEFRQRLEQANADPRVKRSVERLLLALPHQFEALNPALVRSKTRPLEASAASYIAAGAEAELSPTAVADLLDLVGTLKDLQGCFPQIADVERNTVAIDIAGHEQEVEEALSAITESVRELSANYPSMVTDAATAAVGMLDDDISDASNQELKRDLLARSALVKRNFVSAFYRKLLFPVGRELARVGKRQYNVAVDELDGVTKKSVGTVLPLVALGGFDVRTAVLIAFLPLPFKGVKQAKEFIERFTNKGESGSDAV